MSASFTGKVDDMSVLRCRTAVLALAVMATIYIAAPPAPARAADVSFSFFYSNLSPHGTWLAAAECAQVWQPREYETGWNPYYDGHWVYTDCGWTWVSDYGWGDLPYHY